MIKRVRARALALVNWKGVFYTRYELDEHVTALEGANGAGKTTVMIGAYVVLLPDMSRLRFTNLGETGGTGGDRGIWGRLGEPGKPSYAALDFELPSKTQRRVVAGVLLERKGEPTVAPTPFTITGLGDDVRLQDILLSRQGEREYVPEINDLRENVALRGGHLTVHRTARDYFSTLFNLGISPMRLGTDEERNKLNEMLRTSMTGGMSRGLLTDLRSFLLKPETGLADTLQRMRANLDSCRRTRTEVVEAQQLEREIGGVFEAGEVMFAASVAATRERAAEFERRLDSARAERETLEETLDAAEAALDAARAELDRITTERASLEETLESHREQTRRLEHAVRLTEHIASRAREVETLREQHVETTRERDRARREHAEAEAVLEDARIARERAAAGLANLQNGLDELHRRADAHAQVTRRRDLAATSLELAPDALDSDAHERSTRRLEQLDSRRRELTRRIADAAAHRREHARAMTALSRILETDEANIPTHEAHEYARLALSTARDWKQAADQIPTIEDARSTSRRLANSQRLAHAHADELSLTLDPDTSPRAQMQRLFTAVERDLDEANASSHRASSFRDEAQRTIDREREKQRALEARSTRFSKLTTHAEALSHALELELDGRPSLERAREHLHRAILEQTQQRERLTTERLEMEREARALRSIGSSLPEDLLRLRDTLGAELLAGHLEDVPLERAGLVEAHLGPRAAALVVEDLERASVAAAQRPDTLETVWLIAQDADLELEHLDEPTPHGDVIVGDDTSRRITRVPKHPVLGHSARRTRAEMLEQRAADLAASIEEVLDTIRDLEGLRRATDELIAGVKVWLAGDPTSRIESCQRAITDARRTLDEAATALEETGAAQETLHARRELLRELLPDADLLAPPDHAARLAEQTRRLEEARAARQSLARTREEVARLELLLEVLREPPLTEPELEERRSELAALDTLRDELDEGLRALTYVLEHRAALDWGDAADKLRAERRLVPALEEQLEQARAALERSTTRAEQTRQRRDTTQGAFHVVDGQLEAAQAQLDQTREELRETGIEDASRQRFEEARAELERLQSHRKQLEERANLLAERKGQRQSEWDAAVDAHDRALQEEQDRLQQAIPATEAWEILVARAREAGVLEDALTPRFEAMFAGTGGSPNRWARASEEHRVLIERLRDARGVEGILDEMERWEETSEFKRSENYLKTWVAVRGWLRRRLPAQIAEVDDPLEALARLRTKLAGLLERLERQEQDLRGTSEDVARNIDIAINRARTRVRRLNHHLGEISFGSIAGVKVDLEHVERMRQVLTALREGAAQQLLFQADMPVEEALDEIFRRHGGGRASGQRLLDYREYIHLQVQIRRHTNSSWERANPTRLSTGEAIGVGAALMMVVLTEWEHDAMLLRGKRAIGSMRFLFLDEANRLDRSNLGTLFELCRSLDLQLLVAAPEVAQAHGCTVFRLVRVRTDEGHERVLVEGRRLVPGARDVG